MVVLLGKGDGTFQAPLVLATLQGGAEALAAGDVNGDGFVDVITHTSNGTINAFFGKGDGTFVETFITTAAPKFSTLYLGHFHSGVGVDIMVVVGSVTTTLLGDGTGTFGAPKSFMATGAVFPADVNGDGVDDLFEVNIGKILVHQADGTGAFSGTYQKALTLAVPIGGSAADMNGDGKLDAVVIGSGGVGVVLNACTP